MLKSGIKKTIFGRWRIKLRSDLRKMLCIKKQNFNFSVNILVNSFLGFLLLMGLLDKKNFTFHLIGRIYLGVHCPCNDKLIQQDRLILEISSINGKKMCS